MKNFSNDKLKKQIYNNLTLTYFSNKDIKVDEILSEFILRVIGYKPSPNFILDIEDSEDLICPILSIFKALIYLNHHSFNFHEKIFYYFNKSKEQKNILKQKYDINLEDWEDNWILLVKYFLERNIKSILEVFLINSKNNPNELTGFKVGMIFGLVSGNKLYLKELAENYYSLLDNHNNSNFIGIYAFILEELSLYDESEKWVKKGLELDPYNIWTQHVYAHITYQTDRIPESLEFLEKNQVNWTTYGNSFISKHIKWHLAIAYLEIEDYSKATILIDDITSYAYEQAECPLSILGYILRVYLRKGQIHPYIKALWIDSLLLYFQNKEIFTKHLLFDAMSVWLMSHLNNNLHNCHYKNTIQNTNYLENLDGTMAVIKSNIPNVHPDDMYYYENSYLNILEAMIKFGNMEYEACLDILIKEEDAFWKIGASDEQLIILFEIELYCSALCKNKSNFERLKTGVFSQKVSNMKIVEDLSKHFEIK